MLRYWEVVGADGMILAAGLDDSKHLQGQDEEKDEEQDGEFPAEATTPRS